MTAQQSDFLYGTLFLIAGVLLLTYLEKIVELDQKSEILTRAFFRKKLGNSILNRDLWSIETQAAVRASRIALRCAAVVLLLTGTAVLLLAFRHSFR